MLIPEPITVIREMLYSDWLGLHSVSGPITSWEIDGQTVSDFIFLGSKITADGDCSHEIKRRLLLGRKVMSNQQPISCLFHAGGPTVYE